MRVVILAGGLGTRLAEETRLIPKPMVPIGERPILWHIMKYYATYGFIEFVLALGYKAELVKRYFIEYNRMVGDIDIKVDAAQVTITSHEQENWKVHLVDTGVHTMTGGRLRRLKPWLQAEPFMLTYGDGLSNVDLQALLEYHFAGGKCATITAVRPPARFGELGFEDDRVSNFSEKPNDTAGWINGGFMVLEPDVLDLFESDASILEKDGLERLAADRQLVAYRHLGFWQCMDTLNEKRQLERYWESGNAPWKIWASKTTAAVQIP